MRPRFGTVAIGSAISAPLRLSDRSGAFTAAGAVCFCSAVGMVMLVASARGGISGGSRAAQRSSRQHVDRLLSSPIPFLANRWELRSPCSA
jgi:hypothetical protein